MNLTDVSPTHRWLTQDLGAYNAWDAYATAELEPPLKKLLAESGNSAYAQRWFTRFVPTVMAMQRRGVGHLDRRARWLYARSLRREMREVERIFMSHVQRFDGLASALEDARSLATQRAHSDYAERQRAAHAWAAESPRRRTPDARLRAADTWLATQLAKAERGYASGLKKLRERRSRFYNMSADLKGVVFDDWGLRPAPVTRDRTERSLDQESLLYVLDHLRVRDEQYREALECLCHRSRLRTIAQRYLRMWVDTDDRVYPTVQCASARTMRLAYGDPALQQWPAEIRHLIRPAPGHVYVSADYSQVEARIAVIESGDKLDLELFQRFDATPTWDKEERARWDVHIRSARDRARLSFEEWLALAPSVRKLHRDDAKRFRYRLVYGGDDATEQVKAYCPCPRCVEKVPQLLKLPQAERIAAQQRWHGTHPEVLAWQDAHCDRVRRNGNRYTSRFGYTRHFSEPWPKVRPAVLNFPMQHGAAEVIDRAMEELHWVHAAPLVLQMHDNLMLEAPRADAPHWAEVLEDVMTRPVPEYDGAVFPVEMKPCAEHWGEA